MEDFVTYELAKKLKEKGFSQDFGWSGCKSIYSDDTTIKRIAEIGAYDSDYYGEDIPCPTIVQALKWLREEEKIHLYIDYESEYLWLCLAKYIDERMPFEPVTICAKGCNTYESAALAGIEYVLDNLI